MSVASEAQIGEAFVGHGAHAAHVNTVLGHRGGPVETAWATALATPRAGHVPFVCVVRPNVPVQPMTLFVNKAAIESDLHGDLTWGAAQAGVAGGFCDAVGVGVIDASNAPHLVLIVAVWVNPDATDSELVYRNNREATLRALEAGAYGLPTIADVLAVADRPANPYFTNGVDLGGSGS
mgnify:FL=1